MPHPGGWMQPCRVLQTFVVEDNPVILDNLVAKLAARRGEIELVIVDIFLKSGSGLGVLRAAMNSSLPARRVVLTNFASPDMRAQCKALGADCVFDKSNDLDELMAFCCRLAEGGSER